MTPTKTPAQRQVEQQAKERGDAPAPTDPAAQPDVVEQPGQDESASPRAEASSPQQAKETTSPVAELGALAGEVHDALRAVEQRFAAISLTNSMRIPGKDDVAEVADLLDEAAKKLRKLDRAL